MPPDEPTAAYRTDDDTAAAAHDAIASATDDLLETATTRPLIDLSASVFADVALPAGLEPTGLVPHWEAWCSRPTYDDFWRSFDPEPDYGRIDVPGLHVTGWYELCQSGAHVNYRGLRDRSPAPQHLIVGPWTHGGDGWRPTRPRPTGKVRVAGSLDPRSDRARPDARGAALL
jgi:predicted acyl esterase